jgi:hypothetical protein
MYMNEANKGSLPACKVLSITGSKALSSVLIAVSLFLPAQPCFSATTGSDWDENAVASKSAPVHSDWDESAGATKVLTASDWDEEKGQAASPSGQQRRNSNRCRVQPDLSLVVKSGTRLVALLNSPLDSSAARAGEVVQATLADPVCQDDTLLLPSGSTLNGQICKVTPAHRGFGANGRIEINFTSISTPDGRTIPILASVDAKKLAAAGGDRGGRLAMTLERGAVGAVAGAAAGAAVGVASTAMSQPYYGPYWGSNYGPYYGGYYNPYSYNRYNWGYYNNPYSYNGYNWGYYNTPSYGKAISYGAAGGAALGLAAGLVSAGMKAGHDIYVVQGMPIECQLKQDITFQRAVAVNPALPSTLPVSQPLTYVVAEHL